VEGLRSEWKKAYFVECPVKRDVEVSEADIAKHNLILVGDKATNSVIGRMADRLPPPNPNSYSDWSVWMMMQARANMPQPVEMPVATQGILTNVPYTWDAAYLDLADAESNAVKAVVSPDCADLLGSVLGHCCPT
jgi:hypothetical protein